PLPLGASARPCLDRQSLSIEHKAETPLRRHLKPSFAHRQSERTVDLQQPQAKPSLPTRTGAPEAFETAIYSPQRPDLRALLSEYTGEVPRRGQFPAWQSFRVLAQGSGLS